MTAYLDSRLLVNQLLTDLALRLHGGIDFWTLVCVSPILPDPRAWIAEHHQVLKALVIVIEAELPRTQAPYAANQTFEMIRRDCEALEPVFLILAAHRQHPPEEVHSAVADLNRLCTELLCMIAELGQTLGCPVSYLEQMPAERKAYYQRILDNLADLLVGLPGESASAKPVEAT